MQKSLVEIRREEERKGRCSNTATHQPQCHKTILLIHSFFWGGVMIFHCQLICAVTSVHTNGKISIHTLTPTCTPAHKQRMHELNWIELKFNNSIFCSDILAYVVFLFDLCPDMVMGITDALDLLLAGVRVSVYTILSRWALPDSGPSSSSISTLNSTVPCAAAPQST